MNNKKIMILSLLTLFVFSSMIGFVEAAYAEGEGCDTGLLSGMFGRNCEKGLKCVSFANMGFSAEEVKSVSERLEKEGNGFNGLCVAKKEGGAISSVGEVLEEGTNVIKDLTAEQVIENVLNTTTKDSRSQLFDRTLVFILVSIILYAVFYESGMFGRKETGATAKNKVLLPLIVSGILGLIGIRFISNEMISSLATPSTALAALIFAGLPFLAVYFITTKIVIEKGEVAITFSRWVWSGYALLMAITAWNSLASTGNTTNVLISVMFIVIAIIMVLTASLRGRNLGKKEANKKNKADVKSKAQQALDKTAARFSGLIDNAMQFIKDGNADRLKSTLSQMKQYKAYEAWWNDQEKNMNDKDKASGVNVVFFATKPNRK